MLCVSADTKALQGSEMEARELLGGVAENSTTPPRGDINTSPSSFEPLFNLRPSGESTC